MEIIRPTGPGRYAILRFGKIKTQAHFDQIDAELDRELTGVLNGDGTRSRNWVESRSHLNLDLLETPLLEQAKSTYARVIERIGDQPIRKNAVLGVEMFMGFSPGMSEHLDIHDWARQQIAWVEKTFGRDSLIKAVLHLDEETPHIHAIIVPFCGQTKTGIPKLNCRGLIGDRGSKKAGRIGQLEKLQDSYADHNKQFGLERGLRHSATEHIPLKKLRREDGRAADFAGKLRRALDESPLIPQVPWSLTDTPSKWIAKQKKVIEEALANKQSEIDQAARGMLAAAESILKHRRTHEKLQATQAQLDDAEFRISMVANKLGADLAKAEKERSALASKVLEQQSEIDGLRKLLAQGNSDSPGLKLGLVKRKTLDGPPR